MTTRNRGKESDDDKFFSQRWLSVLKEAVDDLCFLLTRGYAENSALQVVGNRYRLNKRQRNAVLRISCSNQSIEIRHSSCYLEDELEGKIVDIDGFNLIILLESALSGAYVFKGRDGLYRDISSVYGSYKRVVKTEEAILIVGRFLKDLKVKSVSWYLDQPVSNSGRLKTRLMEISNENDFRWYVNLVFDPDKVLSKSKNIVVSSDGWVLEQVEKWFNLGAYLIEGVIRSANVIDV